MNLREWAMALMLPIIFPEKIPEPCKHKWGKRHADGLRTCKKCPMRG